MVKDIPPRKKRFDTKCEEIKKAAIDWLQDHDTVNAMEIYSNYGIRRQTAGKWLKVLCSEGTLEKVGRARYKLPSH
jgi:predicted transcriptional regulator